MSSTAAHEAGRLIATSATVGDWGGLQQAQVAGIARPRTETELQELVRHAAVHRLPLSLRGCGHSAGGQSFAEGAVMVDTRGLNRVLAFDPGARSIRLQAGATWATVTAACEPHGLGPATKQEFDSFTIGGSLAANAHGKSIDHGPLISSVRSLRLLTARGEIVRASREENAELFAAAVGGYGLLGVIVDATLDLVDDRPVRNSERFSGEVEPLLDRYLARVRDTRRTPLCSGFLDRDLRRGFYVAYTYEEEVGARDLGELERHEPPPALFNRFVALQRRSALVRGQSLRVLSTATRRPELTLRSRRLLLWDAPPSGLRGTVLQKYIVPVERFQAFAERARTLIAREGRALPLLTPHFRFIPGGDEALLALAEHDSVCLILSHLARPNDRSWRTTFACATCELLEACLEQGGRHYLTFDVTASREQLVRAYPRWPAFVALKQRIDPDRLFKSSFYERYEGRA